MSKDVPGDMAKNVPADVPKDLPADVPGDVPAAGSEAARHDDSRGYGFELPLLLFGGFRSIIDDLHAELARRGHPDMRPAHGFALQAIGPDGATATQAGRRLGISKQAAGKTIERLEELGYVRRSGDDADRRRKVVRITPRGQEALGLSAMIFDDIRAQWAGALDPGRLAALEADLRTMVPSDTFRLDVPGWFGT
jgi:DNA-binding MarR family transcriptional regulator